MDFVKRVIKEYGGYVLIIIVVILVKMYIVSPVMVSGESMYSTLHGGDVMILDKLSYHFNEIKRFDIVVVKYEKKSIIKRVIGLPGDVVECIDNKLYINGKIYVEKYLDENTVTNDFDIVSISGEKVIPDNYYLVLGDNREISLDSRRIGLIKKSDIEGKASFTIFPFNRFGKKE